MGVCRAALAEGGNSKFQAIVQGEWRHPSVGPAEAWSRRRTRRHQRSPRVPPVAGHRAPGCHRCGWFLSGCRPGSRGTLRCAYPGGQCLSAVERALYAGATRPVAVGTHLLGRVPEERDSGGLLHPRVQPPVDHPKDRLGIVNLWTHAREQGVRRGLCRVVEMRSGPSGCRVHQEGRLAFPQPTIDSAVARCGRAADLLPRGAIRRHRDRRRPAGSCPPPVVVARTRLSEAA